ncbi:MAG TPA: flagellar filament capping protein FliD [Phycisphaerales bacterium]|nr:flagellar filament capping protein FliD [Phycisphaerales bacterium]
MAGITTGTGIFSGIDSASLISQLMAVEQRPKQLVQLRVQSLQFQQAAYLDLNSRLTALKTAAAAFRTSKSFQLKTATSTDSDILTATAGTTATAGSYTFIVDRLVTSQQLLSRGFANRDSAAVGATSLTFESTKARLDRDVALTELNGGQGVSRGKIVITDSSGAAATVDLSRTVTVGEVLAAINTNGTARVTASVQGGRLILKDTAGGGGTMQVADATGYTTATSLGIAGSATAGTLTGSSIYGLGTNTPLSALNDGNGVAIKSTIGTGAYSFTIGVGGATPTNVQVNLGDVYTTQGTETVKTEGAVTTVGGVVTRINAALTAAGVTGVTASIDQSNGRLLITDGTGTQPLTITENNSTTARDLGLTTATVGGSVVGRRVFAGLNTTLATGLNGGSGLSGDGVLNITARDGTAFSLTIDTTASLTDIFAQIETASGTGANGRPRLSIALDSKGTGFTITDNTGGSSNLIITGTNGQDTATSLGIATDPAGIASATKSSGNLQRQYISLATPVSALNNGRGIGTGKFTITDGFGSRKEYDIGSDTLTVADLINEINATSTGSATLKIRARINATGDGIEIIEDTGGGAAGTAKIKISDTSSTVAKSLNIAGEASDVGASNKINGSYERTVTLSAADTLQQVADKINAAKVGASASIINDGSGLTPFRLSLSSTATGEAGRFIFDAVGADFGFSTLDVGQNSRVFYGASDPARAVAVIATTNTVDTLVPGVKIDLKAASPEAVTLNVASDTTKLLEAVKGFVSAFNTVLDRISAQTKYDATNNKAGPLTGDGTTLELRSTLYATLNEEADSIVSQYDQLTEVGLKITTGGKLELDEDKFREALATDPSGVEALFAARVQADDTFIDLGNGNRVRNPNSGRTFSSLGVMGKFEQMVEKYLDTVDGVLTLRGKGLEAQIKLQNDRISAIDVRLAAKEETLRRQFLAMEQAVGQLQSQSSALSSLGSLRTR